MHRHITMKEQYTVASANDSTSATSLVEGLIVDANRGQYWVDTPDGVLLCTLRGRLRKQLLYARSPNLRHKVRRANVQARDPVAVGLENGELISADDGTAWRVADSGSFSIVTVGGIISPDSTRAAEG